MKRIAFILISVMLIFVAACSPQPSSLESITDTAHKAQELNAEERQRIALYVSVMKAAFNEENGGSGFVAVKLDTLDGLSEKAKSEVLKELSALSPNIVDFEKVRNDSKKFELDEKGNLVRSINGSLLYIELKQYSGNKAVITGVSWFGNLGAVFPEYEATYENGRWRLKLIGMAIS